MDLIISAVSIATRRVCQARSEFGEPEGFNIRTDAQGEQTDCLTTSRYCVLLHEKATVNLKNMGPVTFSLGFPRLCLISLGHSGNNNTVLISHDYM